MLLLVLQRNESELEGMAVANSVNVVGDNDSSNPTSPSTNPDDNEGHKEASGKKKKNRCLSCKKKVGLTGNTEFRYQYVQLRLNQLP